MVRTYGSLSILFPQRLCGLVSDWSLPLHLSPFDLLSHKVLLETQRHQVSVCEWVGGYIAKIG